MIKGGKYEIMRGDFRLDLLGSSDVFVQKMVSRCCKVKVINFS
jgi:hypothetical protein